VHERAESISAGTIVLRARNALAAIPRRAHTRQLACKASSQTDAKERVTIVWSNDKSHACDLFFHSRVELRVPVRPSGDADSPELLVLNFSRFAYTFSAILE
jgi:hypothetical protein